MFNNENSRGTTNKEKKGNTNSVRLGAIILLIGSIIITFSKSYFVMMIGQILYTISFIFKAMDSVMLKNDLVYLEKKMSI